MSNITYTQCGDYFIPNIILKKPQSTEPKQLSRYGCIRQVYLKTHRPIYYNQLLLSEQLFPHLHEIDKTAQARRQHGVSEEVIFDELVYE